MASRVFCLLLTFSLLACSLGVQTSGCPAYGATPFPAGAPGPDDYIELQRGPCLGPCPVYSLRIYADGRVDWKGIENVQVVGVQTARVPVADARALIEKSQSLGFQKLCDDYSRPVTDRPTTRTSVHLGNTQKSVSDYADSAPGWLRELDVGADALADTHRWIHGDPRLEVLPNLLHDGGGPKPGLTDLMRAAWKGDLNEIERQFAAGANPNARDSSGATALMYATRADSPQAMARLLQSGADPNLSTYKGQTALMSASISYLAPKEKIKMLLDAGAKLNTRDNDGQTAVTLAERYHSGDPDVAAFLRAAR